MLDSVRHDEKFAGLQLDDLFAEFDPHPAAPDEKQLIFVVVMVPGENALKFYQLHFLAIEFADDLRPPMFAEGAEFFGEVYFLHRSIIARRSGTWQTGFQPGICLAS